MLRDPLPLAAGPLQEQTNTDALDKVFLYNKVAL